MKWRRKLDFWTGKCEKLTPHASRLPFYQTCNISSNLFRQQSHLPQLTRYLRVNAITEQTRNRLDTRFCKPIGMFPAQTERNSPCSLWVCERTADGESKGTAVRHVSYSSETPSGVWAKPPSFLNRGTGHRKPVFHDPTRFNLQRIPRCRLNSPTELEYSSPLTQIKVQYLTRSSAKDTPLPPCPLNRS